MVAPPGGGESWEISWGSEAQEGQPYFWEVGGDENLPVVPKFWVSKNGTCVFTRGRLQSLAGKGVWLAWARVIQGNGLPEWGGEVRDRLLG